MSPVRILRPKIYELLIAEGERRSKCQYSPHLIKLNPKLPSLAYNGIDYPKACINLRFGQLYEPFSQNSSYSCIY